MPPTGGRRPGCWTNGWSSKAFPQKKQLTTAADGKAALEGLPTGLYLLCAVPYQKGGCTYTTTPVLLELPAQQAGGGWQYAATVEPKLERSGTPEPPVIIIPDNPAPHPRG